MMAMTLTKGVTPLDQANWPDSPLDPHSESVMETLLLLARTFTAWELSEEAWPHLHVLMALAYERGRTASAQ